MNVERNVRRAAAIFMLALVLTASTACRRTPRVAEYDALSAFIDTKFADRKGVKPVEPTGEGITRIVIRETTDSDERGANIQMDGNGQPLPWAHTASSLQTEVPTLKRTTMDAFREANEHQTSFRRSFHFAVDYELVDPAQLDSVFKNGGWPAFYKRFPGSPGIVAFSRVGFSRDGTQALFYVSHVCGELCAGGEYVIMEKRDRGWVIEKEIQMWMSWCPNDIALILARPRSGHITTYSSVAT